MAKAETRRPLDERLERKERMNPSGHGEQSTPQKQREIAESPDHPDERATTYIDPKVLKDLKD